MFMSGTCQTNIRMNTRNQVVTRPSNSPDLNPIEHLCDVLDKQGLLGPHIAPLQQTFRALAKSTPEWLRAVLVAQAKPAKS